MILLLACSHPSDPPASADLLRFQIEAPENSIVSFSPYHPDADVPVGAILKSVTAADALAGIQLDPPAEESLEMLDPAAPEMRVALWVPALQTDENGDGVGEDLRGVGEVWPTFVEGPIADADGELHAGWNAVRIDATHAVIVEDASSIPLPENLAIQSDLLLSGNALVDAPRLVLANPLDAPLLSQPLQPDWRIFWEGAPPSTHFASIPSLEAQAALESPFAVSEDWQPGTPPLGLACAEETEVQAAYLQPVLSVGAGLERLRLHLSNGWNLLNIGEEGLSIFPLDMPLSLRQTCE